MFENNISQMTQKKIICLR